jgi:two-component system, cell cycle sensor histidine kinase and response regulator CckA
MAEHPKRTGRILLLLQMWEFQIVRLGGVIAATLVFLGLSKYLLHSDSLFSQSVLFAISVFSLGVLDHYLRIKKTPKRTFLSESEKQQSQKMEAIGRLAGGVAHDFNNLLAVISGYSDLLLQSLGSSDVNRTKLEQIKQAANSAASLTRQLLMFSRQQVVQPLILDINQIVASTEKMLRRLIKENIEFAVILDPCLDAVKADPVQIEQIILNLVVNARDALPNGGKLSIQTRNARTDHASRLGDVRVTGDRFVLLEVTDTGIGMDQETQAHVFEPFFTTKEIGRGTGLGLATVYGIVKQSNGYIDVESVVGRGTSFRIYFPAVEKEAARQESGNDKSSPTFSNETVLVVEDAPALRDLICEVLQKFGCSVLSARNAQDALQLAKERQSAIDLLLTDVIMPGMDGPTLAKEIHVSHPETKILYMTGYSGTFIRTDMLKADVSLIRKPFTPSELGRKIRKMLLDKPNEASNEGVPSIRYTAAGKAGVE